MMPKKQRKQNKMSSILTGLNETQAHDGTFLLTESRTYKLWESAGQKIAEAQLTVDQINQIFQSAEKIQSAGGDNRTMLGKGKDIAGKGVDAVSAVNKAWEDLKTKVQDSGPVKGVDAMYDKAAEKLKQSTGGDQGVMKYVQKYRDFAKEHPIAQGFIYSALIAAAGISGAGLGGAAVLGLFKMVDKLLQGDKFSSAAYSGAKTGAMAYGASKIGDLIKGAPKDVPDVGAAADAAGAAADAANNINVDALQNLATDPNLSPVAQKLAADLAAGKNVAGASEYLRKAIDVAAQKATMMGDMPDGSANAGMKQFMSLQNLMQAADGHPALSTVSNLASNAASNAAANTVSNTVSGTLSGITGDQIASHPAYQAMIQKFGNAPSVRQAAMSAAKAAILKGQTNESIDLTESQIFLMIGKIVERQRKLDEGIMDTVKGAAGKAVDWAKTKGTNLTTKVTADKLLQAWKKAGSPTDSLDVASIVQQAGVPSASIKQVYSTMKIPFAGEKGAGADTARKIDVDPSSVAPGAPTSASPAGASTPASGAPAGQTGGTAAAPAGATSGGPTSGTTSTPATGGSPAAPTGSDLVAQVQALIAKLDAESKEKVVTGLKTELSVAESHINELSTNKLAQYKTAAAANAKKADSQGNYKRGDKRMSGIVRATKKQFANDEKDMTEGSQRGDTLVTDALKIMRGSDYQMDPVRAIKTVLGEREYNSRRGFYNFYVKQLRDMYDQEGLAEGKRNLKCVCKTHGTMQCPVHTPKDIEVIENKKNKKA